MMMFRKLLVGMLCVGLVAAAGCGGGTGTTTTARVGAPARTQIVHAFDALNAAAAAGDAARVCSFYTARARAFLAAERGGGSCVSAVRGLLLTRGASPRIVGVRVLGDAARVTLRRADGSRTGALWRLIDGGWKIDQPR